MAVSPLAPDPRFRESEDTHFETGTASNPNRRGPNRFQEGLATDSDVPRNFAIGVGNGAPKSSRPNTNAPVWEKSAAETMSERAHVGSASWPEAPSLLSEFASGSGNDGETAFVQVRRSGRHQARKNYAEVD